MHFRLFVGLVGCYVATGQVTLSVPAAGNCGDDTVLTCRYDTSVSCTTWRFFKGGTELIGDNNPSTSKYVGFADPGQRTVTLTIKNMEMTDSGGYKCFCTFSAIAEAILPFECKPTSVTERLRQDKRLEISFNQVYPNPSSVSVTVNSIPMSGTHTCTGRTSTSYSCTWTSSSSLEDVDGGYRVVMTTVTQMALTGNIKIVTPGPPNVTNREQLPDGRSVIRVTEGSQVTLECVSSGGIPASTVALYRDSISTSPLSSISTGVQQGDGTYRVTLTHTITASRSEDLKTFVCRSHYPQATSTVTQGSQETTVLMYLNLKPSQPTITQTNTPVSTGTMTLQCRTSGGRPAPTVTWTYRGQTFSPQVQSDKDVSKETYSVVSTLQRPVTAADNGEPASCHLNNTALTSEQTTNVDLSVKFPVSPASTVITGNRGIIATGFSPLNLNCTTGSSNPASNITWRRGSTVITNSNPVNSWTGTNRGVVSSQILTLTPTRYDVGEVITCSVTNSDSDVAASQGGDVNDSVTLNLTYSPEIQSMTSITVDEGQVGVVLSCIVSSKPVSTITWFHGGSSLVTGQGTTSGDVYNSLNYTLTTVSRDDQGTYRCRADNQIGSADNKDVTVNVRYVIVTAINTTTNFTSTTVTCILNNFGGSFDPKPWVQKWQQSNGEYVEVNSRLFSNKLNLVHLTYQHSGVYICMVKAGESGAIYVQGNISILIQAPPVILEPKIIQNRYKISGRLSNNATVYVQYYSNVPGSQVKCYRSNNNVRSSTPVGYITLSEVTVQLPVFSHTIPTLGTLATVTIMINNEDDFGEYDIVITNGIGSGSTLLISIIPQGPPDAPSSVQIVTHDSDTVSLMWIPGNPGGLDQTFIIQLSQNGIKWVNKTSVQGGQDLAIPFSATLDGLKPTTKYFVRLFAYNSGGQSKGFSDVLNFTTDTKPVTCTENSCAQGQLVGGMVGTLILGLLVGIVFSFLVQRYGISSSCLRPSNDNVSDQLKESKELKTRQGHYQNPSFTDDNDNGDDQLTGQAPAVYETLETTQRESNYASLQTATNSGAAYYNLNL